MMGEELVPFLCLYQANFTVCIGWNKWNNGPIVLWKTVENLVLLSLTIILTNNNILVFILNVCKY